MPVNLRKEKLNNCEKIDGGLLGIIIALEVCFSKALIIIIPFLVFRYMLLARSNKRIVIDRTSFWICLMVFFTTINGIRLKNNTEQFSILYNTVTFLCVLLVQMIFLQYRGNILGILKVAMVVSTVIAGVYIFFQEFNMLVYRWHDFLAGNSGYRLGVSSNINPNTITWTFGTIALFTIIFAIDEKKWSLFILYVFDLIIIFFTGSKNGLILAFLPVMLYAFRALKKANIKVIILIIILFTLLWIAMHKSPVLYTLIGRRIDSMLYTLGLTNSSSMFAVGVDNASTEKRVLMIEYAIKMFKKKPLLGWGIGAFAQFAGFGYYCHNNYMEILVSGGIILFILYYSMILIKGFEIFRMKRGEKKDLVLILFCSIILLDFSTVNFYSDVIFYIRTIIMFELLTWRNRVS